MSIRDRGDGRFQIRAYAGVDEATGKGRYLYRTTRAGRKAAERIERELQHQVDKGRTRDERVTVGELLDRWYEQIESSLSPGTAEGYRRAKDQTLKPAFGKLQVEKLTIYHLDELYNRLGRRGLGASAIHQVHSVMHGACAQAIRWGWMTSNPASSASPPPVRRKELEIPTGEEINALYGWAVEHDKDLAVLIRLAASTGARRGELGALRWTSLDLDERQVTVSRNRIAVKGAVVEKSTKGRRARSFGVDPETIAILRAHRARELEKALRLGVPFARDAPVLTGMPGKHWYPDTLTTRYAKAKNALGLTTRLQDLRHWHVSALLAAGVPVIEVSRRVGHASAKMTLDVYGHLIRGRDDNAAAAIAAHLDR